MKLISRRSAIMALTNQISDWNDDRNKIVEQCIDAIRGLKVHDSKERKTGKWIIDGNKCVCSSCGSDDTYNLLAYKYCPWCGNPMEVEE